MRIRIGQRSTLFDGALKTLIPSDETWLSRWEVGAGFSIDDLEMFAYDAFGVLYGIDGSGVVIFWTETGQKESLGISEHDFYNLIENDPNATINYDLYLKAVEQLGRLPDGYGFAMNVESALGGKLNLDNLHVSELGTQMFCLGALAAQIGGDRVGQRYSID